MTEEDLRKIFESKTQDSYGFRRSRKGVYINPAVSRDWKWFKMGFEMALSNTSKEKDEQ